MPYKLEKRENQVCVINSETGESKGCSASRAEAVKHMRLLYHVESGGKLTKEQVDKMVMKAIEDFEVDEIEKAVDEVKDLSKFDKSANFDETNTNNTAEPDSSEIDSSETQNKKSFDVFSDSWGVTSYQELEGVMEARERTAHIHELIHQFPIIAQNIMYSPEINDKGSAIQSLASELVSRVTVAAKDKEKNMQIILEEIGVTISEEMSHDEIVDVVKKAISEKSTTHEDVIQSKEVGFLNRVSNTLKSLFKPEQRENDNRGIMIWKEGERYFWVARYSNNFRDRDNPPEIISANSHRRFVERVEKGLAPYPELWLWHVPNWKIGQSTLVTYDDAGFALAAGYFHKGCEQVAEWLSKQKFRVSHGMPPSTIARDSVDKSVIIEHESREISPLPAEAAANLLTGFVVHTKEADMAIPQDKRDKLIGMGLSDDVISAIEKMNTNDADKAVEAGIERKEKKDVAEETQAAVVDATEASTDTEEVHSEDETEDVGKKEVANPISREEIAEAISNVFMPVLKEQQERIEVLEEALNKAIGQIKSLSEDDTVKIVKNLQHTPAASLSAMLAKNLSSVGSEANQIDGRSSLAKKGPEETPHSINTQPQTAVPLLNTIIASQRQPK